MVKVEEKKLRRVLKSFNAKVLLEDVIPQLPVITLDSLNKEIRRLKLSMSQSDLIDVFVDFIKRSDASSEDVGSFILWCELKGIAENAHRKKWTAFSLGGEPDTSELWTPSELENEIKSSLMRKGVNSNVKALVSDYISYINIQEKKLVKKRLVTKPSLICATSLTLPYIFTSTRTPPNVVLMGVTEALGYPSFKKSQLDGSHLDSLLKLLTQRGQRPGSVIEEPLSNDIIETPGGIDYSQHENRRKYMNDLMGLDPPKISNYTVEAMKVPWQGKHKLPGMEGVLVNMKLELKSSDTVNFLKVLGEEGILQIPAPSYVTNILNSGKNILKIKPRSDRTYQSETDASER